MGRDMQHSIKHRRLNNPSALAGSFYTSLLMREILKIQSGKHKCKEKLLKFYHNVLVELIIKAFFYGNKRGLSLPKSIQLTLRYHICAVFNP